MIHITELREKLRVAEETNKRLMAWPHCEVCNFPLQDQGTPNGMVCLLCDAREKIASNPIAERAVEWIREYGPSFYAILGELGHHGSKKCDDLRAILSQLQEKEQ